MRGMRDMRQRRQEGSFACAHLVKKVKSLVGFGRYL
jgi:hypothetical protein